MIIKKIIIFILIVGAFVAGVYFKENVFKFYNGFSGRGGNFKITDIGSVVAEVSKQLLTPPPLLSYKKIDSAGLLQSKIISGTNVQRQQNGNLPALVESARLDEAAGAKANDMFINQYFEHVSPSGVDPGALVKSHGYDYIVAGENLILGNFSSEKEVVQDWMNSPGHRANILNNRYTEIGAAIIKGTYKGETVWIGVQEFGVPSSECTQPNVALKNAIDADKTQMNLMVSQINDQKSQIENTNKLSPVYNQMVEDYNQLVSRYDALAENVKSIVAQYNGQVNSFNNCVAGK